MPDRQSIPFRVLGPMVVTDDDGPITIGRTRERALLALLLMHRRQTLSRDEIIEALWGDETPDKPVAALQTAVSRLRSSLGGLGRKLVTSGSGYMLDITPDDLDADIAAATLARVDDIDPEAGLDLLETTEHLWRGPAYEGFRYADFAQAEVRRLDELLLAVKEQRIRIELAMGHHELLVPELHSLVVEHPLHEGLWRALMLALYRSGRQADALRAFRDARSILGELGIDPSDDLADVEVRILQHDPELMLSPVSSRRMERVLIPQPTDTFHGRRSEFVEIAHRFSASRVVTLTGTGGVGKTRLAVEFANRHLLGFAAHPLFLPLEEAPRGGDVLAAAASVLGVSPGHSDPIHGLANWIGGDPRLLIVDGVERMVGEAVELVDGLTKRLPELRVLITSRTPTGSSGEVLLGIVPLGVGHGSDAAALFAERAGLDGDRTAAQDDLIDQIVAALDGIPLLIELAAGRSDSMSLERMASELAAGGVAPVVGRSGGPQRHQSVEAMVRWSWDLLSNEARRSLARVSVFAADFDVHAAASLFGCSEDTAADLLEGLCNHSLLASAAPGPGGVAHFRLLSPIRSFAARMLAEFDETSEMRSRHAMVMQAYVSGAPRIYDDPNPAGWLPDYRRRVPDFSSAFEWLLDHDPGAATSLACDLAGFWGKCQEYGRGRRMLESALARFQGVTEKRAHALLLLGMLQIPGRELGAENVSFSHPFRDWRRMDRRPRDAVTRGREAAAWLRQGVDLAVGLKGRELEVFGRTFLGVALGELGDLEGAQIEADAALALVVDAPQLEAPPTSLAANLALAAGDFARAQELADRAYKLEFVRGDAFQMIAVHDLLARLERARGNSEGAAAHFATALDSYARPSGQLGGMALLSIGVGSAMAAAGQSDKAREYLAEALATGRRVGMPRIESPVRRGHALVAMLEGDLAAARHHLELGLEHCHKIGCPDELGQTLSRLGQVAERERDLAAAGQHYRAALRTFVPEWPTPDLALALEGTAACRLADGAPVLAARFLGSAARIREQVRSPAEWWTSAGATAARCGLEMGLDAFEAESAAGRAEDVRSIIAEALAVD